MKAFISYSHKDEELKDDLEESLATLGRQGYLATWHDRLIDPGGNLDLSIKGELESSDLFLQLISRSYISSNYCMEKEFLRAQELRDEGRMMIISIIVRDCDWNLPEIKDYVVLPTDGHAVRSRHWHNEDEAWADVARELRKLIEKRRGS